MDIRKIDWNKYWSTHVLHVDLLSRGIENSPDFNNYTLNSSLYDPSQTSRIGYNLSIDLGRRSAVITPDHQGSSQGFIDFLCKRVEPVLRDHGIVFMSEKEDARL